MKTWYHVSELRPILSKSRGYVTITELAFFFKCNFVLWKYCDVNTCCHRRLTFLFLYLLCVSSDHIDKKLSTVLNGFRKHFRITGDFDFSVIRYNSSVSLKWKFTITISANPLKRNAPKFILKFS